MPEQSQEQAAQEIIALEQRRCAAYLQRDIVALDQLLPDYFSFTRPSGIVLTKAQLLAAIACGELTFESFDRHYDSITVHQNTAAATGLDTVRGSYLGQDIGGQYRFRNVYVQRSRGWEVAATHASKLVTEAA